MVKFGTYRNVVLRSVNAKAAKTGLRLLAKTTPYVVTSKAIIGLNLGVGELMRVLTPYVLGEQLRPDVRSSAIGPLSQVGYNLVIMARTLKIKLPTATKKIKMSGTLTTGLLRLNSISTGLLDYVDGVFQGPQMKTVTKEVVLPNEGGKKEMRPVQVVDLSSEVNHELNRQGQLKGMVLDLIDIYWKLTYSLTGYTPDVTFERNEGDLRHSHPHLFTGTVDSDDEADSENEGSASDDDAEEDEDDTDEGSQVTIPVSSSATIQ